MTVASDMCDIVHEEVGETLRVFVEIDPETRDQHVLYARDDVAWNEAKATAIDSELHELVAKSAYERKMEAGDVTHIVKVADEMVVFTGFIQESVIVATFDRGVLVDLGSMIRRFRDYLIENDIDFIALDVPESA